VAALTMFIGMGVYGATLLRDPSFAVHRVVIRAVYPWLWQLLLAI
jgi:hypothetical protein